MAARRTPWRLHRPLVGQGGDRGGLISSFLTFDNWCASGGARPAIASASCISRDYAGPIVGSNAGRQGGNTALTPPSNRSSTGRAPIPTPSQRGSSASGPPPAAGSRARRQFFPSRAKFSVNDRREGSFFTAKTEAPRDCNGRKSTASISSGQVSRRSAAGSPGGRRASPPAENVTHRPLPSPCRPSRAIGLERVRPDPDQ